MFKIKKILSVIFISLILISVLSFSVFAEGESNLVSENLQNWVLTSDSDYTPTINFQSNERNRIIFSSASAGSFSAYYYIPAILLNHTYTFSFKCYGNYSNVNLYAFFGTEDNYIELGTIDSVSSSNNPNNFSVSFTPSDSFSFSNGLKIFLFFDVNVNVSNFNLYVYDISLIDNNPSSPAYSGLEFVFADYINPSVDFLVSNITSLFSQIESHWYLLFVWYLINSGFIIFVVVNSVWNWVEIASEGTFDLGLMMLRKNKFDRIYEEKAEERRKEAEEQYKLRKAERESELEKKAKSREENIQIGKKQREQERNALQHYIGGTGSYSNQELAEGYFKKYPNRYSVTISGHKYFNLGMLERAKRDSDKKNQTKKDDN